MELEIIMVSELSQSHKDKFLMFSLMKQTKQSTKVMKVKEGLLVRWKGKGKVEREGGIRKSTTEGEYEQNTLYRCMEM
jgi:hypothetical protein